MPRQARRFSHSGYLHIIMRGIGKQILFEEREDYCFFLSAVKRFLKETNITLLAYCLMDNHVHLLICDTEFQTPVLIKKIGVSYSGYYNRKYKRTGHLFQDRYHSEPVEDERYLLTVFRYILKNPEKAGICNTADYEWSSYSQYNNPAAFVQTQLFQTLIGDQHSYDLFLDAVSDDECLEFESKKDDEWAKAIIRKYLGCESGTVLQSYDRSRRDTALRILKEHRLTIRQIERLTGINRGVIQRA